MNVVLATTVCAALGVVAFLVIRWFATADYRAGERAFNEGRPMNVSWSKPKQAGWSRAWGERLRSKLGLRG